MPRRIAFRHLESFLALARDLNVTRAAEGMNIAQPALSQQIQLLESRIGTSLFERNARPLKLTEAGRYFQAEAASLVARFDAAVTETQAIALGHRGWLGIGFTRSAMYDFLPPIVRRFTLEHPNVDLRLHEMLTEDQPEALHSGIIHVGLARDPGDMSGVSQELLLRENLVAALPRGHALARRRTIRLSDLAAEPFILFPKNPGARFPSRILALCRDAGFTAQVAQETFEIQTALGLVAAGLGVTLVTAGVARIGRPDLAFKPLDAPGFAIDTALVALTRPGGPAPLVEAALALMRLVGDEPQPSRPSGTAP